ncbi:hypothetical protein [Spirosoma pollinicola]|uniref:Uncharacterized protein n=1 Tax=Spirosoma pollinicola TaxID=2057025 RepID=A0A2K8ZAE3_9BACT|nr:hypothetical protein [Spirosoma pollinicola]AUD06846.1 hypothetical protein CWM47_36345 [Spirosoma pollinicola]
MKLNWPLRFDRSTPRRLEPVRFTAPFAQPASPAVPFTPVPVSLFEFKRLLARYKRAGFEGHQIWRQSQEKYFFQPKTPISMLVHTIIDPFTSPEWMIEDWSIKFMLSERLLTHARKQSDTPNWYEDPLIAATWGGVIATCFRSVQAYHKSFAILPMVGDRLFNEDTGWQIKDRSIDGDLMTITFTLDS